MMQVLRLREDLTPLKSPFMAHVPYLVPTGTVAGLERQVPDLIESIDKVPGWLREKNQWGVLPKSGSKIMVIRHGGFGDWLMITPALRWLRSHVDGLTIDCAVDKAFIEAIEQNPNVDQVLDTSFVPLDKLREYDRVFWFNLTIESAGYKTLSGSEIFATRMGIRKEQLIDQRPEYHPSPQDMKVIDKLFEDGVLDLGAQRIMVQINGSCLRRTWPFTLMVLLLQGLSSLDGVQIYLVGKHNGEVGDWGRLKAVAELCPNVINLVNRTPRWSYVAALLKRCQLFIGADSSFAHVAAAYKVPAMVFYGSIDSDKRLGKLEGVYPLESGKVPGTKRLHCQPCFMHSSGPCPQAMRDMKTTGGWAPCLGQIKPRAVFNLAAKILGRKADDFEAVFRNHQVRRALRPVLTPEATFEISSAMKERKVQVGIIFGGAGHELHSQQLTQLAQAKTFDAFADTSGLTILDNADPDTQLVARGHSGATVLRSKQMGYPPIPYNDLLAYWAEQAPADWLIIMDDDIVNFRPGWLAKLITRAEQMGLDVWGIEQAIFGEVFPAIGFQIGFASAVIGISQRAFERIGYFDEGYIWHGFDSDYVARAHNAGLHAGVVPGSAALLEHVRSVATNTRMLESSVRAAVSYKYHARRWMFNRAPLQTYIGAKDVLRRSFIAHAGASLDVERTSWPGPERQENVSVIIPSAYGGRPLFEAVRSIINQVGEVVMVRAGSFSDFDEGLQHIYSAATQEEKKRIRVVEPKSRLDFSAAVNAGALRAKQGNHLLLFNDDARALPSCVQEMVRALIEVPEAGVVSSQHIDPITEQDCCVHAATRSKPSWPNGNYIALDWAGFCSVLIRRECWDAVGPLDVLEHPRYGSDRLFCLKAARKGWQTVCAVRAKAYHDWGRYAFREGLQKQGFNV